MMCILICCTCVEIIVKNIGLKYYKNTEKWGLESKVKLREKVMDA